MLHVFARRSFLGVAALRSSCAHMGAFMPNAGHSVTFDMHAHSGIASLSALNSSFGIGIARAPSSTQRGGSHRGETDSAANQFGAPESAKDPRGTISVFVARVCPSRSCRISRQESDYENR